MFPKVESRHHFCSEGYRWQVLRGDRLLLVNCREVRWNIN